MVPPGSTRRRNESTGVKESSSKSIGDFEIVKTLGHGSFGKVKLARHKLTRLHVAMKFLSKKKILTQEMRDRVKREIEYLSFLRHPHIIKLYDVIQDNTDIVMVIEYLKGELFDYIVQVGKMPEQDARRFFQQIICAVEYCHLHNIVHRDLKPENLLLDHNLNVKIADFGLSNIMRDGDFLKTSCGSPNYAAPEVISGKLYAGPEIDIWSCGVILFVMLCGRLPFDDDHIPMLFKKINSGLYSLPPHLSPGSRHLLSRMLVVDVNKRITIPEIRKLDWFNEDLPEYLKREHRPGIASPDDSRKGSVSEPAEPTPSPYHDFEDSASSDSNEIHIPGLGILDPIVINDLCNLIGDGITADDLYNILKELPTLTNSHLSHLSLDQARLKARNLSSSTGHGNPVNTSPEILLNQPLEEPEIVPSFIRVLPHTLPNFESISDQAGGLSRLRQSLLNYQASPLKATNKPLTPAEPSKGDDKRLGASNVKQLPTTRTKKTPRTKWHFGIRSKSPPMTVMLEIYRTLQTLGFEFKRKETDIAPGDEEQEGDRVESEGEKRRRRRKADDDRVKRAQDLYFIETRCRLDDVMVRMDLQLYQIEVNNYLVDFRNLGYKLIRPTDRSGSESSQQYEYLQEERKGAASSPFLFLECACRLIVELAVGPPDS
ncbi:kinase-like domain-containing protein [Melampsora americana]|nr:kinase-like domain-containing protein [Melampsora americana]